MQLTQSHSAYNDYQKEQRKKDILSLPETQKLFYKLDADPKLVGAGVIYIDQHYNAIQLREFNAVCRIKPINIIIHEIPSGENINNYTVKLRNHNRQSQLMGEAVATLLSCSAAFLGWVVVSGSIGAAPITAGTSSVVTVLAIGAATASSAQCLNGVGRTGLEAFSPDYKDFIDSQEWYQEATKALDLISLAGVGASGLSVAKGIINLKATSSRSFMDILKSMTRAERTRLSKELAQANTPGLSNKVFKQMVRAGEIPKRFTQHSINQGLMLSIKDAIGATLSFSGSAFSGNVKNWVIGVYEAQ